MNISWLLVMAVGVGSLALAPQQSGRESNARHGDPAENQTTGQDADGYRATSSMDAVRPREFPDGQAWMIDGGLAWGLGFSDAVVFVPDGFVHDRASVPPVLWSLASYTRAAVIHDWLYWAQPCSRLQADNLLMIAMKEAGMPWLQRTLVYRSVRLQGLSIWNRNAQERAMGLPRLNPYGYVPDNMTWPQLREKMFREGVRDVRYVVPNAYCRYGDSKHLPGPAAYGGKTGGGDLRGN